jgi:hypothetical protein
VAVFDRHVVVDWSANSTPKRGRDSVWIAVRDDAGHSVTNLPTRSAALAFLIDLIGADPSATVLLGVDFSLGYPVGTAGALGLAGSAWTATWDLLTAMIRDDDRNANNRFAVAADLNGRITGGPSPFWGCPPSRASATLTATKPVRSGGLATWRAVEEVLRSQGRRPFSSWQLTGAGAVGSQSLLGIPRLQQLRRALGDRVEVWPFTTGLRAPRVAPGRVVVAEVWPSMTPVDAADGPVRDAAQVVGTARRLAEADRDRRLIRLFEPELDRDVADAVVAEEGWVLGVVA